MAQICGTCSFWVPILVLVKFAHRISTRLERGYRFLGFVDDDWPGFPGLTGTGFKVVSDFQGLAEYLRRNVVDEVAIYSPFGSFYRHSSQVASLCEQHGITMRFNSDIFGSEIRTGARKNLTAITM